MGRRRRGHGGILNEPKQTRYYPRWKAPRVNGSRRRRPSACHESSDQLSGGAECGRWEHHAEYHCDTGIVPLKLRGVSSFFSPIRAHELSCRRSRLRLFQELRLECYLQSLIAKGAPPAPVDALETPWAVIQPTFKEFRSDHEQDAHVFDSPMSSDENKDT